MMQHIIGIDVETTALEPEKGEIIEVAAVRYSLAASNSKVTRQKAKFVRLCKPSRLIPDEITVLTGITNEMVVDAPPFAQVVEELQKFIGDDMLFAHNASFDLKWLRYHGLSLANNKVWDTFPIAAVAWPEAESYALGALANDKAQSPKSKSGRGSPRHGRGEHSAEYDVEMAWRVLQAARQELQVSPGTYKRVIELLERAGISHYAPLFSTTSPVPPAGGTTSPYSRRGDDPSPQVRRGNEGEVTFALGPNGPLAKHWSEFTARPEQQQMAEMVATTVREGGVSLIEAPTGIGKTIAYLTPLLSSPTGVESKAMISTYTKHLQDQLLNEDVPRLQAALGMRSRVAVLKGRRNYVCTRRLGQALDKAVPGPAEAWLLIKILVWLAKGGSGDIDRLNISHQGEAAVATLHADSPACRNFCARQTETTCPYQQAWQSAEKASVLIINHALLADPTLTTRWPLKAVIIDEAHHLEEALRRSTQVSLHSWYLQELLNPLLQLKTADESTGWRHIRAEASDLLADYMALVEALRHFVVSHQPSLPLRLTPTVRRSSSWGSMEKHVTQWSGRCSFLIGLLESSSGLSAGQVAFPEIVGITAELKLFADHLVRFIAGASDRIQWVDIDDRAGLHLHDVALSIAPFLERLYETVPALVLTSATLTTGGTFAYLKDTLGLPDAHERVLPSSFPLRDTLLLYLVEDSPDPRGNEYDAYIASHIKNLALLLKGRTLGLFTSFKSITTVFKLLNRPLNKAYIRLYAQGHTGGRSNMLKRFREEARSVLLGTDSFWEGIDVPGSALSCVVIPKLPFAPPHDPVTDAVAEARGIDAFSTLSLPRMILKLRQGVGRLIRRRDDRGVVVIFDSRLHTSQYGEAVIKSLPAGRIKIGSAADLPKTIEAWIGKEILESWKKSNS